VASLPRLCAPSRSAKSFTPAHERSRILPLRGLRLTRGGGDGERRAGCHIVRLLPPEIAGDAADWFIRTMWTGCGRYSRTAGGRLAVRPASHAGAGAGKAILVAALRRGNRRSIPSRSRALDTRPEAAKGRRGSPPGSSNARRMVPPWRSVCRSASTMMRTKSRNVTAGFQSSTRRAFSASPTSRSTSAGRKYLWSATTCFSQSRPRGRRLPGKTRERSGSRRWRSHSRRADRAAASATFRARSPEQSPSPAALPDCPGGVRSPSRA